MIQLRIKARKSNTGKVLKFVTAELEKQKFPAVLYPDILVATEEIYVNIAEHAYPPGQEGYITLTVLVEREAVIRFEDMGKPYNPLETAPPNLDVPLIERAIGGLGIHFVKNLMDDCMYKYTDNKNIFTMTKKKPRTCERI